MTSGTSKISANTLGRGQAMLAAVVIGLAVLATGCGGTNDGASTATSAAASTEAADSASSTSPSSEASGVDELYPDDGRPTSLSQLNTASPIAELTGMDLTAIDSMEAEQAERMREVEEKTAICMREQGFEYTPRNDGDMMFFLGGDEFDFFSSEWINKYGLGISTQRFDQETVGPDLVGMDFSAMTEPPKDPNQDYVESLSAGERDAYYLALNGEGPEFDPMNMTEEELQAAFSEFEPSGCNAAANDAVFAQSSDLDMAGFYNAFGDEIAALNERVEADPRVVEYRERVDGCVSDAGWPEMSSYDELYEHFGARLDDLDTGGFGGPAPPLDQEGTETVVVGPQFGSMSAEDRAILAEVQAEEIEFAKVLVGCDGGPLNEMWFTGEIRRDIEQQWIDANREAIDEFRNGG